MVELFDLPANVFRTIVKMLHKRTSTKAADLPIDKGWAWVIIVGE